MWFNNKSSVYRVYTAKEGTVLFLGMPGLKKEHVQIFIDGDQMKIEMEVPPPHVEGAQIRPESTWGKEKDCWYFSQLHKYDVEKIQAKVEDGVLRLDLPFAESAKPRQISIN